MSNGNLRAYRTGKKPKKYRPLVPRETDLVKKYSRSKARNAKQQGKWEVK